MGSREKGVPFENQPARAEGLGSPGSERSDTLRRNVYGSVVNRTPLGVRANIMITTKTKRL